MHYAISYVSTVAPNLPRKDIEKILEQSRDDNTKQNITGILLYSNGNFFQVLEGNKEDVLDLFSKIKQDDRHYDVLTIFKREVEQPKFQEYQVDFMSLDAAYKEQDLALYFSQVKNLNPSIQGSVKYVLGKFS